ncbi:MAG: GNAT family N-acetyltransferase, partial [Methanobacteriota archaeon]
MSSWSLRRVREGDAPSILFLARTLDKWFNEEGLSNMARDLGSHEGLVAVRGDVVIGFITWNRVDAGIADLSWMGVAESDRRSGIGTALLEAVVADLRRFGVRRLEVSTVADSVDYEPYVATRRFYRAVGFVDDRVDPLYFGS